MFLSRKTDPLTVRKFNPNHDKGGKFSSGPGGGGSIHGGDAAAQRLRIEHAIASKRGDHARVAEIRQTMETQHGMKYRELSPGTGVWDKTKSPASAKPKGLYESVANEKGKASVTHMQSAFESLQSHPHGVVRDTASKLNLDFQRADKMPHSTPEERAAKITGLNNVAARARSLSGDLRNSPLQSLLGGPSASSKFSGAESAAKNLDNAAKAAETAAIALRGVE